MAIQAKATRAVSQVMSLNMLMWLAMLTLFAAILALATAMYMALASVLAPGLAALFTGLALLGVFILLAIGIGLGLRQATQSADKPEKPVEKPVKKPAEARADNTVEQNLRPVIGDRATEWTRDNTGLAVVGALSAGVLLAASPRLRHLLVRAAGPIVTRKAIRAVQDFTER